MLRYLVRRLLYAIPTLIGVSLVTFFLFFGIYSPDEIARKNLTAKNPTPAAIEQWKKDHGYNKPRGELFKDHMEDLLLFRLGKSDQTKEPIWDRVKQGAGPSASLAGMILITSLIVSLTIATGLAYFRGTYIDKMGTLIGVIMLSVPYVVYILGMQFLLGKLLKYGPMAGYTGGPGALRFLVIPVVIGVIARIGGDVRLYRTFLLDEIGQDYVRTARAKGVRESVVLFKHVLKNTMIPVITTTVSIIPSLILGSLLLENTFSIPGLGSYLQTAITQQDFAVVKAMVFLGTVLYIVGLILTDVLYAAVDPRVRLG
jgi:peptide/nickel transport system permease protein